MSIPPSHPRLVPLPLRIALASALVFGLAATAGAVPASLVTYYDGIDGWGLSADTAAEARDLGIPTFRIGSLETTDGLSVLRDFDPGSVTPTDPVRAQSRWTVENGQGRDLDSLFLVLAKPLDHSDFDFEPSDVGITLQNEMGGFDWVIFEVPVASDLYYYPAVSLGSLGDGQATLDPFLVHYSLRDPPTRARGEEIELGIPQWHLLALTTPVPEPSTALLVALGMVGLAARRRSRS